MTDVLTVLFLYDHDPMPSPGALYDLNDSRASQRFVYCSFFFIMDIGTTFVFYLDLIPRHAQPQFVLNDMI